MPSVESSGGRADLCHAEACDIQFCLSKNNYQQAACQEAIQALIRCCEAAEGKSVSCAFAPPPAAKSKAAPKPQQ